MFTRTHSIHVMTLFSVLAGEQRSHWVELRVFGLKGKLWRALIHGPIYGSGFAWFAVDVHLSFKVCGFWGNAAQSYANELAIPLSDVLSPIIWPGKHWA